MLRTCRPLFPRKSITPICCGACLESARRGRIHTRSSANPTGTFDTLAPFLVLLDALENAFVGAYLTAVQESAVLSVNGAAGYTSNQLEYFAKVAASICCVEAEHRVLGRVIGNMNPANQKAYEQTDGLTSLAHGPNSAVDALAPFLNPATGPGYSFQDALANQGTVILYSPVQGQLPTGTLYQA